jgi:hypothetical protein
VDDGQGGSYYGYRVALDGDTALISATKMETYEARLFVFERSDGVWEQTKMLRTDGFDDGNILRIALDGDTGELWLQAFLSDLIICITEIHKSSLYYFQLLSVSQGMKLKHRMKHMACGHLYMERCSFIPDQVMMELGSTNLKSSLLVIRRMEIILEMLWLYLAIE